MTDDLRAITVRQPWAWAIAHGGKTIENRSRGTSYRGPLLIHAGAGWSARGDSDPRVLDAWTTLGHPITAGRVSMAPRLVPLAKVIAVAQLVDSHPDADCCRPWGESEYAENGGHVVRGIHHLVLEDVRPLREPIPARGSLGLWRPAADVATLAVGA